MDFEWVFRDFAPLDSLIQVAGRCNRSGEREKEGLLLISMLQNENGWAFSSIYDSTPLGQTRNLLEEFVAFGEDEVPGIVARYYQALSDSVAPEPLWKNIEVGNWGEYTPLFKDTDFDVPVYVDHDGELDDLLNELMTLDRTLDNRERLKDLNNRLQQYAIGVKKGLLEEWSQKVGYIVGGEEREALESVGDYYVIRPEGIGEEEGKIYHPTAGFSPLNDKVQEEC